RAGRDVDDAGPAVGRVDDALGDDIVRALALLVEHFDRQDLDLPGDPSDADPVVPDRPDDPGDRGAVRRIVARIRVVVDEVVATQQVRGQVGMVKIDPGVQHCDDDAGPSGGDVPGGLQPDAGEVPL